MNKFIDDIDFLFREGLKNNRDLPSNRVWEKIESDLEDDKRSSASFSKLKFQYFLILILLTVIPPKFTSQGIVTKTDSRDIGKIARGSKTELKTSSSEKSNVGTANVIIEKQTLHNLVYPELIDNEFVHKKNSDVKADLHGTVDIQPVSLNSDLQIGHLTLSSKSNDLIKHKYLSNELGIDDKRIKIEIRHTKHRFSLTPFFSKEFVGYSLADNDVSAADGKEIEKRERNVFSASVGAYLNYELTRKWSLQTGVYYSWSNSLIDSTTNYAVQDNQGNVQFKLNMIAGYGYLHTLDNNTQQPAVGDSISAAKAHSRLHFISVPIVVNYNFYVNKFLISIGAGGSINILTKANLETKIYGSNFEQNLEIPIKGIKKINYGVILKAEIEYQLFRAVGVEVIPCFKSTLSPINFNSALSTYPYNFGIGFGVKFSL
ncbi:MAG TPA: outer membrane beta-barrel protein [Chitinophagaceae bacterium]|jgi:hypothetical protein